MPGLGLGITARRGGLSPAIAASLPSLDLDFTQECYSMGLINKPFGDIITFTRASAATRINAAGQIESVAANVPRIDYDPVTLDCKGLLIEEQRTNLWSYGNVATGHTGCVRSDSGIASIFPAHTWQRLTISSDVSQHSCEFHLGGLTAGLDYIFSVDVRRGNFDQLGVWNSIHGSRATVNLASGTVDQPLNVAVKNIGGGRYRISTKLTANASSHGFRLYFNGAFGTLAGNGTDYFDYANPQVELGAFETSYIPTSGAQATRPADVCRINTLSPWFAANAGTLIVEYQPIGIPKAPAAHCAISLVGSSGINERLLCGQILETAIRSGGMGSGGVDNALLAAAGLPPAVGTVYKSSVAFDSAGMIGCTNGGPVAEDVSIIIPSPLIKMCIGSLDTLQIANMCIRRVRFLPKKINASQIQALTV